MITGAHQHEALAGELRALKALGVAVEATAADARFAPAAFRETLAGLATAGAGALIVAGGPEAVALAEAATDLPVVALDPAQPELAAWRVARILALAHPDVRAKLAEYRQMRARQDAFERTRVADLERRRTGDAAARRQPAPTPEFQPHPRDAEDLERLERELADPSLRGRPPQPASVLPKPLSYSPALQEVFSAARGIARAQQNDGVTTEHFLAAILDTPECAANAALLAAAADLETLAGMVAAQFPPPTAGTPGVFALGEEAQDMLDTAKQIARDNRREWLTTADLLESLAIMSDSSASEALWAAGLTATAIADALRGAALPDEVAEGEARRSPPRKPEPLATLDPGEVERVRRAAVPTAPMRPMRDCSVSAFESGSESASDTDTPKPPDPATLQPSGPSRIVACNPDNPEIDVVEDAADRVLDGGVIALPSDAGYMLACDATNPAAVESLRAMRGIAADRPIGVFVHSTAMLKHIASAVPAAAEALAEAFWPGPLTIVFARHPHSFRAVSRNATIGVRIPRHYVALSVLSMVGRPVAVVRPDGGEGARVTTAAGVKALHPEGVSPIVDGGSVDTGARPSIVSVAGGRLELLREGAIPPAEIETGAGVKFGG